MSTFRLLSTSHAWNFSGDVCPRQTQVNFFAEWCIHCHFAPKWMEKDTIFVWVDQFRDYENAIHFGGVQCMEMYGSVE